MKRLFALLVSVGFVFSSVFYTTIKPYVVNGSDCLTDEVSNRYLSYQTIIENAEGYRKTSNETVQFIDSNIFTMAEMYNSQNEIKFLGDQIEKSLVVFVLGKGCYATYIDFNDANGYMVLDENNNLYEFSVDGDLEYLKNLSFAFYSEEKGFEYYDEEIGSLSLFVLPIEDETYSGDIQPVTTGTEVIYAGQDKAGDGYIYDLDAYVANRYPKYSYHSSYSVSNYLNVSQWDTSIYLKNFTQNGTPYVATEGNCTLNATYSVLNSWRQQGLCPLLPVNTIRYNAVEREPKHQAFLSAGWSVNDRVLVSTSALHTYGNKAIDNVPQLYADVRQVVYEREDEYGYQLEGIDLGLFNNKIAYLMRFTLSKYSYFPKISNFGDDYPAIEFFFIQNGMAQMLIVSNSSSYGNHAMGCYGYAKYTYKTGWWIFSSTKNAYFLKVDDGHSTMRYNSGKSIWYDPDASSSSKETIYVYDSANS